MTRLAAPDCLLLKVRFAPSYDCLWTFEILSTPVPSTRGFLEQRKTLVALEHLKGPELTWEDVGEPGRTSQYLGGPGGPWVHLAGPRGAMEDLGGRWPTWEELGKLGSQLTELPADVNFHEAITIISHKKQKKKLVATTPAFRRKEVAERKGKVLNKFGKCLKMELLT